MKCPICEAAGEKSRVNLSPALPYPLSETFYDEEGRFHSHDKQPKTYPWRCTRGHTGTASTREACPSGGECGVIGGLDIKTHESKTNAA